MPRREAPDLSTLPAAPSDAEARGVRVNTTEDLGDVVRAQRAELLGRQADAASRLGLSLGVLGAIERGDRGVRLNTVMSTLADLGLDVVLVPRDRRRSLRESAE